MARGASSARSFGGGGGSPPLAAAWPWSPRASLEVLVFALVVGAVGWALRALAPTLIVALTLALLGSGLVNALERRRVPRAVGALVAFASLGALFALLLLLVLPRFVRELSELLGRLPRAVELLEAWVARTFGVELPGSVSGLFTQLSAEVRGLWLDRAVTALKSGGAFVGEHAGAVMGGVGEIFGAAATALFVPVLAYFMLVELPAMARVGVRVLPRALRAPLRAHGPAVGRAVTALVKGQVIVAGVMAVLYAIGLAIAGVPLAVAIGLLAGLAYLIPFASPVVCIGLSAIFVLLEPESTGLVTMAGAVVTAVVVQVVEGSVLTPRIVGEQAGLSPLAVVVAVLVFGELFGFLGLLYALPLAAALAVVLTERDDEGG